MRVYSIAALSLLVLFATGRVGHSDGPSDDPFGDPFGDSQGPDATLAKSSELSGESSRRCVWIDADPETTERVLALLESPLSSAGLDFIDTPLEEVTSFLRDEYPIEIQIDELALDDLGIGPGEPVSIAVENVKLGVALRLMLQPLELTYYVSDGVLVITSHETSLTHLVTAIYPVADIAEHWNQYDQLIELVTKTVAVDTWAEHGGGESDIIPYPWRGVLVVSQTTAAHEQINKLLNGLSSLERTEVEEPHLSGGGGRGGLDNAAGGFSNRGVGGRRGRGVGFGN